jgi:hypothetical protein
MHTRTKIFVAAGTLAAVLGGPSATATFAGERGHGGWHHGPGAGMGGRGWSMFESFDANGDGKVTQAEVDEVRAQRFAEFDADGDGRLTLEEYQALWLDAMRPRMVDQFQAHDDDGDAGVTLEEFSERYARMVVRLDANGDGEITIEELRERHGDGDRRRSRGGRDDD